MKAASHHFRIQIRKEALKFSAAHMTVFADGTKERIHGHNYRTQVSLRLKDFSLEEMLPFSQIKSAMKIICDTWDERFFLPTRCPFLKMVRSDERETEFLLCGLRYVLPTQEIVSLEVDNITTESLAREFSKQLLRVLKVETLRSYGVTEVEIQIEEMTGQGASFIQEIGET